MLMRHHWGLGVGHHYSHALPLVAQLNQGTTSENSQPSAQENHAMDDALQDRTDIVMSALEDPPGPLLPQGMMDLLVDDSGLNPEDMGNESDPEFAIDERENEDLGDSGDENFEDIGAFEDMDDDAFLAMNDMYIL